MNENSAANRFGAAKAKLESKCAEFEKEIKERIDAVRERARKKFENI